MGNVVKALLWTLLAAGVAMALVVGFGIFQLSQLFPDADEGEAIGEQIASDLVADHPAFVVESYAEASFAEVSISITQDGGQLTEPEMSDVLSSLQALVAQHADSRWDIESTLKGRWDTSPVTISGSDADHWAGLAPVLELADSQRVAITVHLDTNRAVLNRDLDTERLCGPETDPGDFFTDTIGEVEDALIDVDWTGPDDPVLLYLGSGCAGPLRISVDLSGADRLGRVEDLRALVDSLPEVDLLVGVTVRDSGDLELALEQEVPEALAESLVLAWSHGEVWVNGENASSPPRTQR